MLRLYFIVISLVVLISVKAFGTEAPDYINTYDYFLEELVRSPDFSDNVIVADKKIELPIEARIPRAGIIAPDEYNIVGLAGDLTQSRGGRFMAVSKDRNMLYVTRTRLIKTALPAEEFSPFASADNFDKCYKVKPGQLIPGLPGYIFHSVQNEILILQLAPLYSNTNFVDSLLDMYELTKDSKYIDLAKRVLDKLVTYYISDMGTVPSNWMHFNDNQQQVKGRPQAVMMFTLHRFLQLKENKEFEQALKLLCSTFVHTWEGTNDHFADSIIGIQITKQVLGIDPFIPQVSQFFLQDLVKIIGEQGGKAPHLMKGTPNYPIFKDHYQPLIFMQIARNVYFYDDLSIDANVIEPVFHKMLDQAEKAVFINGKPQSKDVGQAYRVVLGLKYYNLVYSFDTSKQIKKYYELAFKISENKNEMKNISPVALLCFYSSLLSYQDSSKLKGGS